jgi:monoterpene epsilon-lactone hydrolase
MLSIQRLKASHILPVALLATATVFFAQSNGPQTNSSVLDANGTAHVTRVVPVPTTISPEAQAALRRPDSGDVSTLAERRSRTDTWQTGAGKSSRAAYPVNIESLTIAGVPVRNITPIEASPHPESVLINLHGGGFNSDSGSFTESIPIANLTRIRVVSVLYRLAPEHPFPAAVDDTIAVYRDLLKTYKPQHIGIYGTSAGAILTAEVAVRLRQLNLPMPAAFGVFSGMGDFSQNGDSQSLFSLRGLTGSLPVPDSSVHNTEYAGSTNLKDPVLSPIYADLKGMPPTLFITSTRDLLLSGTTILHRRFLADGVDARLIVFEALPHAFWNDISLPETKEAYGIMSNFFSQQLTR